MHDALFTIQSEGMEYVRLMGNIRKKDPDFAKILDTNNEKTDKEITEVWTFRSG